MSNGSQTDDTQNVLLDDAKAQSKVILEQARNKAKCIVDEAMKIDADIRSMRELVSELTQHFLPNSLVNCKKQSVSKKRDNFNNKSGINTTETTLNAKVSNARHKQQPQQRFLSAPELSNNAPAAVKHSTFNALRWTPNAHTAVAIDSHNNRPTSSSSSMNNIINGSNVNKKKRQTTDGSKRKKLSNGTLQSCKNQNYCSANISSAGLSSQYHHQPQHVITSSSTPCGGKVNRSKLDELFALRASHADNNNNDDILLANNNYTKNKCSDNNSKLGFLSNRRPSSLKNGNTTSDVFSAANNSIQTHYSHSPIHHHPLIPSCPWDEGPPSFSWLHDKHGQKTVKKSTQQSDPQNSFSPLVRSSAVGNILREWNVDQVCDWLNTLSLSNDYSDLIHDHHIVGAVLLTMSIDDWLFIGIKDPADLCTIDSQLPFLVQKDLAQFRSPFLVQQNQQMRVSNENEAASVDHIANFLQRSLARRLPSDNCDAQIVLELDDEDFGIFEFNNNPDCNDNESDTQRCSIDAAFTTPLEIMDNNDDEPNLMNGQNSSFQLKTLKTEEEANNGNTQFVVAAAAVAAAVDCNEPFGHFSTLPLKENCLIAAETTVLSSTTVPNKEEKSETEVTKATPEEEELTHVGIKAIHSTTTVNDKLINSNSNTDNNFICNQLSVVDKNSSEINNNVMATNDELNKEVKKDCPNLDNNNPLLLTPTQFIHRSSLPTNITATAAATTTTTRSLLEGCSPEKKEEELNIITENANMELILRPVVHVPRLRFESLGLGGRSQSMKVRKISDEVSSSPLYNIPPLMLSSSLSAPPGSAGRVFFGFASSSATTANANASYSTSGVTAASSYTGVFSPVAKTKIQVQRSNNNNNNNNDQQQQLNSLQQQQHQNVNPINSLQSPSSISLMAHLASIPHLQTTVDSSIAAPLSDAGNNNNVSLNITPTVEIMKSFPVLSGVVLNQEIASAAISPPTSHEKEKEENSAIAATFQVTDKKEHNNNNNNNNNNNDETSNSFPEKEPEILQQTSTTTTAVVKDSNGNGDDVSNEEPFLVPRQSGTPSAYVFPHALPIHRVPSRVPLPLLFESHQISDNNQIKQNSKKNSFFDSFYSPSSSPIATASNNHEFNNISNIINHSTSKAIRTPSFL